MASTIMTTEQIAFLIPLSPPLPATKQLRLFLCGALSGIISRTITAPLDRVKIILQVSSSKNEKKTVTQVVDEIWKTEGINGFFRGNITNCIRVAPHNAIRFFVFENMKRFLLPVGAKQLPTGRKLLCGAIAGSCAVVAVHPLDVARARIASQRGSVTPKYKSTFNCLKTVYKEEGLKGLYAGLPVAVSGYAPMSALHFASYELIKQAAEAILTHPPIALTSCYGALSGATAMTIMYPFDLIKTNLMTQNRPATEVVSTICKQNGLRGFYKGWSMSLLKMVPTSSINFFSYELLKKLLKV